MREPTSWHRCQSKHAWKSAKGWQSSGLSQQYFFGCCLADWSRSTAVCKAQSSGSETCQLLYQPALNRSYLGVLFCGHDRQTQQVLSKVASLFDPFVIQVFFLNHKEVDCETNLANSRTTIRPIAQREYAELFFCLDLRVSIEWLKCCWQMVHSDQKWPATIAFLWICLWGIVASSSLNGECSHKLQICAPCQWQFIALRFNDSLTLDHNQWQEAVNFAFVTKNVAKKHGSTTEDQWNHKTGWRKTSCIWSRHK